MYGAYKALGHYPDYWYWILRGRPARAPHLLKQKVVREYGEKFALKTLVETGTYYGEMVAAMKSHFDRIYSIEYVPALAERATRKFARDEHIRIFCGDSRVVMPEVLALLKQPALFWLDAGYYGWVGMRTDDQRLSVELEMILSHPYPHTILLDDARGFLGTFQAMNVRVRVLSLVRGANRWLLQLRVWENDASRLSTGRASEILREVNRMLISESSIGQASRAA